MKNFCMNPTILGLTTMIFVVMTACGKISPSVIDSTQTPERTVEPIQTPAEIAEPAPTPTQDPNLSAVKKMGIDGIALENIECIEFSYIRGELTLFRTSDPGMMQDILNHFSEVSLTPPVELLADGSFFTLTLRFKEIINSHSAHKIVLISTNMYGANGVYYDVTEGAKTGGEWWDIINSCEKILPE